jgi:hypothetical protein
MATASKKTTANNKKTAPPERTTGFRVVSMSYPSGNGCYAGEDLDDDYIEACTTRRVIGEYDTKKQAVVAAIQERDRDCQFDDWALDYYDDAEPPYESCFGDNYDEDENVVIDIVDIAAQVAKENKALAKARSTKAPAPRKAKPSGDRKFGPQKGNFKPDLELFLRHPCRVPGGQSHLPSKYGHGSGRDSLAYMVQRISDRNYTMRSVCLDQGGARYFSFTQRNIINKCVAWLADSNLNDHADDESIVDACHLDLVNHENGKSYLTAESLKEAVHSGTKCLFVFQCHKGDPQAIVDAIQTCASSLQCISLTESVCSIEILQALASCPNLSGILLDNLQNSHHASTANDAGLACVLRACPKLTWLYVSDNMFGTACWTALLDHDDHGTCPHLEVLWVDSTTTSDKGQRNKAVGDVSVIRRALASRTFKLCMVNPDTKLKSRYILGKTDRLDGDKVKKRQVVDEEDDYGDYYGDY